MVVLFFTLGVCAILNWWSRAAALRKLEWITKPAFTLQIIALALIVPCSDATVRIYFVLGFIGCLIGDVFLMLPKNRFIAGLAAFLVAHVFFAVAFVLGGYPHISIATYVAVGCLLLLLATVAPPIIRGAHARRPALKLPVIGYLTIISLMAVIAIVWGDVWLMIGALSFVASDATLGWNRFVKRVPGGQMLVMMTYHVALGVLLFALSKQ